MSLFENPVKWGVLGAARIADGAVVPGMTKSAYSVPHAIAARDLDRAQSFAARHGIAKAYEGYEALLADPDVEAVYIALPNHLHIHWACKAVDAGKHVLIEKPAALEASGIDALDGLDPTRLVSEAFMVRHQPRWIEMRDLLRSGEIGAPVSFVAALSFTMDSPDDFRHIPDNGGGALYDLGCYTAMAARYVFEAMPERVMALADFSATGVDFNTTVMMDFGSGRHGTFTVSLSDAATQVMNVTTERGAVLLPEAFVLSQERESRMEVSRGGDLGSMTLECRAYPVADQYMLEIENFSRAVRGLDAPFFDMADARENAELAQAILTSAKASEWVVLDPK